MTGPTSASPAGHSGRDDLTPRIFRAIYPGFDLLTIGVIHIVTPKGTPVFTGDSLGQIARRIGDQEHGAPAGPSPGTSLADGLPVRVLPRP
jgi:hypothetical protein